MKFTPGPVPRLFLPRPRRASLKLQAAGGPSSPRLCPHPLGTAAGLRETSKHLEESRELRRTAEGRRFASVRRPGREAALRPPLLGHGREREGDGVGGGGHSVAAGPERGTARAGRRFPPARLSGFAAVDIAGFGPRGRGAPQDPGMGGTGAGGRRGVRRGEAEKGRRRSGRRALPAPRGRPVTAAGVVPAASPPRVTPGRKRARRGRPGEGAAMEFPDLGAHCSWAACQRLGEGRGPRGSAAARGGMRAVREARG